MLPRHAELPALINAHDHLQLNNIPGLAAARKFSSGYEWSAAFAEHFAQPTVRQARAVPLTLRYWQGALKNALCGAIAVMHHDPAAAVFDHPGFPVSTLRGCGWAHSLHLAYGPALEESYRATPDGGAWFIHLGEGIDAASATELSELQQRGCLRANTVLIHAVALSDADIDCIIDHGAGVVWCPASNLRILGRTLPASSLRRLFEAGCLALGTDSRLSGSPDLLAELRIARNHSDFSASELLQLVTGGARRMLRTLPAREDYIIFRAGDSDPAEELLRLKRHQLRAVIRGGKPLLTDSDLRHWFTAAQIDCIPILLDGHPKLCATEALAPLIGLPFALEPGLEIPAADQRPSRAR